MRKPYVVERVLKPFQFALVALGLWGCSLLNPGQDVPTYLVVPDVEYVPGELQGTASSNITDVWVYSATDVVGVFPLPAVVPLLPEDLSGGAVTLLAGIRENGLSDRRAPYPFFTILEYYPEIEPGERDTLIPEPTLVENVRYVPIEDFENSNVFGSLVGGEGVERVGDEGFVFEGSKSGRLEVAEGSELARVRTVEQEYALQINLPAFLELDYRCDQTFIVGLYGFRNGQESKLPAMVLSPTDDGITPVWNKIYIDIASLVNAQGGADHFEVYVECVLEAGRSTGTVGLDNLRILTY